MNETPTDNDNLDDGRCDWHESRVSTKVVNGLGMSKPIGFKSNSFNGSRIMSKNSKKNKANKGPVATANKGPEVSDVKPVDSTVATSEVETTEVEGEENAEATVEVVENGKKKRIPMSRVFLSDGSIARIGRSVDTVRSYLRGFLALGVGARKGYDNYWAKSDGFTNPVSIMKLTPDGISKMMAVLHHRAALYIAEGGDKGTQMENALLALSEYQTIAVAEAKLAAEAAKQDEVAATIAKAKGCSIDEARQLLAAFVPTTVAAPAPVASVVAPESTKGETGSAIEDSGDGAEDTEELPVHAE